LGGAISGRTRLAYHVGISLYVNTLPIAPAARERRIESASEK
jgi:hypothetical protein